MAAITFDATQVAPQDSLSPVPAGVYLAHIVESDEVPLKSGAGRAVKLTFQILQGPFANRKVWANINYRHSSADAERIGQAQLSALYHAVGMLNPRDTAQLHMRPVMIRVKVRKDDSGQYPDRNEVTGYEAPPPTLAQPMAPAQVPAQMFPAQAAPQQAFQAPQQAAPAAQAPWARRSS